MLFYNYLKKEKKITLQGWRHRLHFIKRVWEVCYWEAADHYEDGYILLQGRILPLVHIPGKIDRILL